jgi:hypothetical protein
VTDLDDNSFLQLVLRVREGEMPIDAGERAAAEPAIVAALEPSIVGPTSQAAVDAAHGGQWFAAQLIQRLLVAGVSRLPDDAAASTAYKLRQIALGDWVEVAHAALLFMPAPDGRLLRSARATGEHALARATQVGHPQTAGMMHFRLATLYLDPFKARASAITGPSGDQPPWKAAFNHDLGNTILGVGPDGWEMPDPRDALRHAAEHLRAAMSGQWQHPGAAKALAQTLDTQITLGEPVARDELLDVCRTALAQLDPNADAPIFEEVAEILARRS